MLTCVQALERMGVRSVEELVMYADVTGKPRLDMKEVHIRENLLALLVLYWYRSTNTDAKGGIIGAEYSTDCVLCSRMLTYALV
jgi:hypothetical protein